MDDNANELLCVLVWPLQRQQWVLLCNRLVGALPKFTLREVGGEEKEGEERRGEAGGSGGEGERGGWWCIDFHTLRYF